MPFVAVRFDWPEQGIQVVQDWQDAWLRPVETIGVAAAAIHSGGGTVVAEASVAVVNPPIICTRDQIRVFDFVHRTTGKGHLIVRWNGSLAVGIADPDGVSKTEDDAVQTSAAHGRLCGGV